MESFEVTKEALEYIHRICKEDVNVRIIITSITPTGPRFSIRKLGPQHMDKIPSTDKKIELGGISFWYDVDTEEYLALTSIGLVDSPIGKALKFRVKALPVCGGGCTFCHCGAKDSPEHVNKLTGENEKEAMSQCSVCPSSRA